MVQDSVQPGGNGGKLENADEHDGGAMIMVKGTSYYQEAIPDSDKVILGHLELEPDNEYDQDACAVYIDGKKAGYLQKGWKHQQWGAVVVNCIKEKEGVVQMFKVGGFGFEDGSSAYLGLRIMKF
jgi:hypothetical protein